MSVKSYRGYKRFGFLFRSIFASFTGVGVQHEADAAKLRELGCRPEAVQVVGNLKFDAVKIEERSSINVRALLRQAGVADEAPILLGGSTHAGEEALLAELYLRLRQRFPDLFLVLVPRHFERGKEVGRELTSRGLKFVYRTEISASSRFAPRELDGLLVNTTGELKYFYEEASVVFVGKSLTAEGGQNPIEPGALGKSHGVRTPTCRISSRLLLPSSQPKGAVQVQNAAELEEGPGTTAHEYSVARGIGPKRSRSRPQKPRGNRPDCRYDRQTPQGWRNVHTPG